MGCFVRPDRVLESVVYGVSALEPETYLAAGLLMAGLGLLASYRPAVRASRADPIRILRVE